MSCNTDTYFIYYFIQTYIVKLYLYFSLPKVNESSDKIFWTAYSYLSYSLLKFKDYSVVFIWTAYS